VTLSGVAIVTGGAAGLGEALAHRLAQEGAAVVVALGQILQSVVPMVLPSARGDFQSFFLGIILIAMLILLPRGITSRVSEARA